MSKLIRICKYLNGTRDLYLRLSAEDMVVSAYIDASFAVHQDMKSHTGAVITLGKGAVRARSSKQRLVSKSSTESELIGLSDELSQVIWTRNFLMEQGYTQAPAEIHQDNKSTMIIAAKGKSNSPRCRHINIRYYFVKDKIATGEVKLTHTRTNDLIADFFTKPLQGELFRSHRDKIMNVKRS
jgi:hypothetical protein